MASSAGQQSLVLQVADSLSVRHQTRQRRQTQARNRWLTVTLSALSHSGHVDVIASPLLGRMRPRPGEQISAAGGRILLCTVVSIFVIGEPASTSWPAAVEGGARHRLCRVTVSGVPSTNSQLLRASLNGKLSAGLRYGFR